MTRDIPDCYECGEDLAGNVDTDWRPIINAYEREQEDAEFSPVATCRTCGVDVGLAFGTDVVLACFETVGEPTSHDEHVARERENGLSSDDEFTVTAWCPECSWTSASTKGGPAHPVHLPCKPAALDAVEDSVRRHCGEQEEFNGETHHPIIFAEDGAKRFEADVGESGEFAR